MKLKENLSVFEAKKYAEENGYDEVMFQLDINDKSVAVGQFLDAYYGFVKIPVLGDGFVQLSSLQDQYGDRNITMHIIDKEEFRLGVSFDFIIRQKEVPEEFQQD